MKNITNKLTAEERKDLAKYEKIVRRTIKPFYEMGEALIAIRDRKLYRQDYGTFAQYCSEKWGFAKSRAYQLCQAAEVVQKLKNVHPVDKSFDVPDTEKAVRELAKVPEPERVAVLEKATKKARAGGRKVTARDIVIEAGTAQVEFEADNGSLPPSEAKADALEEENERLRKVVDAAERRAFLMGRARTIEVIEDWFARTLRLGRRFEPCDLALLLKRINQEVK